MDTSELTTTIPRFLIRVYQLLRVGSFPCCRFFPSCSDYTLQALETKGLLRGLWLGARRIVKCHHWHPGGHDPITLN